VADLCHGRFVHDRRQIFVGRFYWQTRLANFIVRLTSALKYKHSPWCWRRRWLVQPRRVTAPLAGCPPARRGAAASGRCVIDSWQVPRAAAAVTSDPRDPPRQRCATPWSRPGQIKNNTCCGIYFHQVHYGEASCRRLSAESRRHRQNFFLPTSIGVEVSK